MTKYDLLDVLGSLDEKYLQEAEQRAKEHADFEEDEFMENITVTKNDKPRRIPVYFGATIAAGLALVVGATAFFANRSNNGLTSPGSSAVTVPKTEVSAADQNSSTDPTGTTVPAIVTDAASSVIVTTTTAKLIENSVLDPTTTCQTQDPSLITTGPADSDYKFGPNVFGGMGRVEVEFGGDVLILRDKENMYVSDSRLQYSLVSDDVQYHGKTLNGKYMQNYGLNPRQSIISDGTNLFAYDVDIMSGSVSKLSDDYTEWEHFCDLPFERAENMMIDRIYKINGGYLFVFSNCMNLNLNSNQSAYFYNPKTQTWTPILSNDDEFGSFYITAGKRDESPTPLSAMLYVCRPGDQNDRTKYEFECYEVDKNGSKQISKRTVDTFNGEDAFKGYSSNEWCVGTNHQVYFASAKSDSTRKLYTFHIGQDDAVQEINCECGEIIYLYEGTGMIYTNPKHTLSSGKTDDQLVQINPTTGDSVTLLHNAQIRAMTMDIGCMALALYGDENHGYEDYLIYPIQDEERLIAGEFALDKETDTDFLTYLTGPDGNDSGHAPFPTRARKWMGDN